MNYDPFPMSGTAQADIVTSSILVQCELDSSHHETGENVKNVKFYNQLSPNLTSYNLQIGKFYQQEALNISILCFNFHGDTFDIITLFVFLVQNSKF